MLERLLLGFFTLRMFLNWVFKVFVWCIGRMILLCSSWSLFRLLEFLLSWFFHLIQFFQSFFVFWNPCLSFYLFFFSNFLINLVEIPLKTCPILCNLISNLVSQTWEIKLFPNERASFHDFSKNDKKISIWKNCFSNLGLCLRKIGHERYVHIILQNVNYFIQKLFIVQA